jgi:acyl-CoA thioesterase YciA
MPADTNANGDIFGGWVMSQMDLAGGIASRERAHGRVATVAVGRSNRPKRVTLSGTRFYVSQIINPAEYSVQGGPAA